jgi:hypothetical protein
MLKLLFIILLAMNCSSIVHAQTPKAFYFELGGPGLASVNYDMRFTKNNGGIGGRIGFGGFSIDGETALFFPLQANYLLGKDNRNFFEFGAGATLVTYNNGFLVSDDGDTFTQSFGHLYFGYRLQPSDGGFLFRAGICPIFGNGFFIPYYAGLSFGYAFGSRK